MSAKWNSSSHNVAVFCAKLSVIISCINFIISVFIFVSSTRLVAVVETPNSGEKPIGSKLSELRSVASEQAIWHREQIRDFNLRKRLQKTNLFERDKTLGNVRPNAPLLWYVLENNQPELQLLQEGSNKSLNLPQLTNEVLNDAVDMPLNPADIHFSVRTTSSYSLLRLNTLMHTWISLVSEQVAFVTDKDYNYLKNFFNAFGSRKPRLYPADCPDRASNKWALLCKIFWEFKAYFENTKENQTKKWFCHFDDDTYVNVPALLSLLNRFDPNKPIYIGRSQSKHNHVSTRVYDEKTFTKKLSYIDEQEEQNQTDPYHFVSFHFAKSDAGFCVSKQLTAMMKPYLQGKRLIQIAASISLPDDHIIGYVITHLLNVSLFHSDRFHSEIITSPVAESELLEQVTLAVLSANSSIKIQTDRPWSDGNSTGRSVDGLKFVNSSIVDNNDFILMFHQSLMKVIDSFD